MTTSEKTLLLENLLANKNYLPLKLKATELGRFGLKSKPAPTAADLQNAIEPHLGGNLMLAYRENVLCLAKKMSTEDWTRLLGEEKNVERKKVFDQQRILLDRYKEKEKKSYMPLKLKVAELAVFGLSAKSSTSEVEKTITPFLGAGLMLLKKKPTTAKGREIPYLAYKVPSVQFVAESLQIHCQKKPLALKKAADDVPMSNAEFVALFNQMLAAGQIQITKVDDNFGIAGIQLADSSSPPKPSVPAPNDYEMFQRAFNKLDQGRIYVRICNMRRELGWSEERFDTLLRKLRADGIIQLHGGDPINFTAEELRQCFTDEYNSFYATLTWRKR